MTTCTPVPSTYARLTLALLLAGVLPGLADAQERTFPVADGIERIVVQGVSGDVEILPADGSPRVELSADVTPAGAFRGEVSEEAGTLTFRESWGDGRSEGRVVWRLYLDPDGGVGEIRIRNASGDLDVEGLDLEIDLETASGDVSLTDVHLAAGSRLRTASGDFEVVRTTLAHGCELSTASGDLDLESTVIPDGCRLGSASGDVSVSASDIRGRATFSSASGDVHIDVETLPAGGLKASSASGDVLLEVGEFGPAFRLVLVARVDAGEIVSPFDYTSERTFQDHHVYEEKVVVRGSGGPEIELRTASGEVRVRRR